MEPNSSEIHENTQINNSKTPKFIFIIPYRNRVQHRMFFSTYIQKIMEDIPKDEWAYYFVHQNDNRPFNRGAMKNIGFLAIKYRYPNDYKNIIMVFNDIDTLPYDKNILDFNTTNGTIKHYYGFKFALGGIFSITGEDFEKTSGFPNFWAWGGEDNLINARALKVGLKIDRSVFFSLGDMNILQFADGLKRLICRDELATTLEPDNIDGLTTIKNLNYKFFDDSHMIDVTTFDSLVSPSSLFFEEQTIDRLGRIRVNNRSKLNSINQIKSTFFDELNKTNPNARNLVSTVQSLVSNNRPHISQSTIINRPNYSKQIQPKLPFSHNNYNIQQGPAQQSPMFRSVQPLPTYTPTREIPQGNNIFTRKNQPDQDVVLPLQRPNTTNMVPRNRQNFGMRALFM
jgi:hypothetical protein